MDDKPRCFWTRDPLLVTYHDQEWGVASHDDQHLYEHLVLEIFQAGLSWLTVLRKRPAFRKAFANFDAEKVARFNQKKVAALLEDTAIIRNRQKIEASIKNAQAVLRAQEKFGSFDKLVWQFAPTKRRMIMTAEKMPTQTPESLAMSKALKKEGFGFVGPTGCYAFMQSVGIVNDHVKGCFKWKGAC